MTEKSLPPEERCLIEAVNAVLEAEPINKGKLADKVGISQVLLTRILNGQSRMSAGTWKKICAELKIDYDHVCGMAITATSAAIEAMEKAPDIDPVKMQKQIEGWPPVVSNVPEEDCVVIRAPQEDMYRLFLFCEERMAENLVEGTRMPPDELHKLLSAMYALKEASLRM